MCIWRLLPFCCYGQNYKGYWITRLTSWCKRYACYSSQCMSRSPHIRLLWWSICSRFCLLFFCPLMIADHQWDLSIYRYFYIESSTVSGMSLNRWSLLFYWISYFSYKRMKSEFVTSLVSLIFIWFCCLYEFPLPNVVLSLWFFRKQKNYLCLKSL